jgi:hypothetical protein
MFSLPALSIQRFAALWILLGLVTTLVGCGARNSVSRLPIAGSVSLSTGEKLRGAITFVPVEGHTGPAATTAIVDGRYQFNATNGPTPGPHRVIVKRIDSRVRMPDLHGGSRKTDSKSATNPSGKVEWTFACDLEATDSGPRDFTLDAE